MERRCILLLRGMTSGLVGLVGLGAFSPATATPPGGEQDLPQGGMKLAPELSPLVLPEPSTQPTAPEAEIETAAPAWAPGGDRAVVATATISSEVAVAMAVPELGTSPAAMPESDPAASLESLERVYTAADSSLDPAALQPLAADPPELEIAAAVELDDATPTGAQPQPPDLAALQARAATVQTLLQDLRSAYGITLPEEGPTVQAQVVAPAPQVLAQVTSPESLDPGPQLPLLPVRSHPIAQTPGQPADVNQLRETLRVEPLTTTTPVARTFSPSPNAGIPSGFGADWGDAFITATLTGADRLRPEADGSLSVGFGLGDAQRLVGVELVYNVLSVRNFAVNGSFDAKVHRIVHSGEETQVAAAVGLNRFAAYGSNAAPTAASPYGVVSVAQLLQPNNPINRMPITATVGLGGGGFSDPTSDVGLFAGVGLQVHPQFSVNTAWSGVGLNLAASIVPLPEVPLTLNLLYGDVGNNTAAGSVAVLSLSYGFNFAPRF